MTTGEVVEAMDVGQSTVSHHLQILGETCFVHVERVGHAVVDGGSTTAAWPRFPSAAELIMGHLPQIGSVGRLRLLMRSPISLVRGRVGEAVGVGLTHPLQLVVGHTHMLRIEDQQ